MRILPVLDLKGGHVVRGVAGRRSEYHPIISRLTDSSEPIDVAEAFRAHFGLTELYLADLDAIGGAAPAWSTYAQLRERGFRLWVDAGIRGRDDAEQLADAGIESIVVGLETVRDLGTLTQIGQGIDTRRIVFSLDLKGGRPLGEVARWGTADAWEIAVAAVAGGVRRVVVLDLERVGMASGTGTEEMCRRLIMFFGKQVEVTTGGGVRDQGDLDRLEQIGVAAVLVASALHDGRLHITPRS